MVVEKARYFKTVFRLCPVVEHDRYGREYLHIYMCMLAFFQSSGSIPAVRLYFAEELIVLHHACAAGLVMFEMNEPAIAKLFAPARKMLGNNVGVDVNLHCEPKIELWPENN